MNESTIVSIKNNSIKLNHKFPAEFVKPSIQKNEAITVKKYNTMIVHPCQVAGFQPIPLLSDANHLLPICYNTINK